MNKLNRYLLIILGLGWLSFLIVGILFNQVFAAPDFVLLIDRSYCPPQQWQQVVQKYSNLHQQHQQNLLQIKSVILFNDLGQEVLTNIPTPDKIGDLDTYGRSNPEKETELRKAYDQVKVIRCP